MNFVAIDFETATHDRNSACAVAIVTVERGRIVEEYCHLIQPPANEYTPYNINVHGIRPADTVSSPGFTDLYPEIKKRLAGKMVVAHNESFDRSVLTQSMAFHGLDYAQLNLPSHWQCTCQLYRNIGFSPVGLNVLCNRFGIALNHHEALSDAAACAELYLRIQK